MEHHFGELGLEFSGLKFGLKDFFGPVHRDAVYREAKPSNLNLN